MDPTSNLPMKYVCLCYADEEKFEQMAESDLNTLYKEQVECDKELRDSGNVIASESLEPVGTAATVRIRNGKVSITDGPFAETKEQLGGFFLIEARALNDAIRIASQFPSVKVGSMEVRPVWDIREYVRDLES